MLYGLKYHSEIIFLLIGVSYIFLHCYVSIMRLQGVNFEVYRLSIKLLSFFAISINNADCTKAEKIFYFGFVEFAYVIRQHICHV